MLAACSQDLAGDIYYQPNFLQIQRRISSLAVNYLSEEILGDRLQELPVQLASPQARPWKTINWQAISTEQVIGIKLEVFLAVIKGSLDTEAPIRGYTQTSRKYLENLHPQMASYVGGQVDENEDLLEIGLWEKEERQHTPALAKIYQQLTTEKIIPTFRDVRGYLPTDDPREDLYRHGLHRVATEYGATCLYLWLMAHSTGALQDVLEQLMIDEINHMTKFWGFGVWIYPETSLFRVVNTFLKTRHQGYHRNNLLRTLKRMMGTLNWDNWTFTNKVTLVFTFTYVMRHLWNWHSNLTPEYLHKHL
jgi:hypothetical protein